MMHFKIDGDVVYTETEFGTLTISRSDEKGFRPYVLLVSSIVACSSIVFRNILVKKRIPFTEITIDADVKRDEANANRIEKIHLHFTIYGNDLNETQIKKSLDVARKHCSMIQSVKNSIEIIETYEVKPS